LERFKNAQNPMKFREILPFEEFDTIRDLLCNFFFCLKSPRGLKKENKRICSVFGKDKDRKVIDDFVCFHFVRCHRPGKKSKSVTANLTQQV